eukprot:c22075_g1_i2 orf=99-647(+)
MDEHHHQRCMPDQRTVFLVNIFIVHTVHFLNKFSSICERKLADVHRRILRLDTTVSLLEAKLRSIDGLNSVEDDSVFHTSPDQAIPTMESVTKQAGSYGSLSGSAPLSTMSVVAVEQPTDLQAEYSVTEQEHGIMIKDDPRFSRFFRMLRFGVPMQAVKMQMSMEGFDPSFLDNPDAVMPVS